MRKYATVYGLTVTAMALVLITGTRPVHSADAAPAGMTSALPVAKVIQENLASWRFKPGEEVFVNRSPHPVFGVALTATPDGRLFLAWREGRRRDTRLVVAASPNGREWEREIELTPKARHVHRVAIAANSAGEVLVAWGDDVNCWAAHRLASGEWGEPAVVGQPPSEASKSRLGSIALTADPDGAFWLLALVGPTGQVPTPRLWKREVGGGWQESAVPALGRHSPRATLGYRDGLVSVANGNLVGLPDGETRDAGTSSPWAPPPMAQRTVSLWIRPSGPGAALAWSLDPVQWGAHLLTSQDLRQWSGPAFLGWTTYGGRAAVAATERGVYAATTFEPWWYDRAQREGHEEVQWAGPRVLLLDERLTRDSDADGLTDITEEWLVTDHQNADTDGDGILDGADLDPLAASVPDSEEAQIRQAVFGAVVHKSTRNPLMVVAPQRQVFANHHTRALCLKPEEAEAYLAKYGWALRRLQITDIHVTHQGQMATAKWSLTTAPMAAQGGEAKLEKQNGQWVVTDEGRSWVS